jgi:hypothetical protein
MTYCSLGLSFNGEPSTRTTIWKPGTIAPLQLNHQLHEEAMEILYRSNAFQFSLVGSKISFLRLLELKVLEEREVDTPNYFQFDDEVEHYIFISYYYYFIEPEKPAVPAKTVVFNACRSWSDKNWVVGRYSILNYDGTPHLPRDGLRRIRFLNLNIEVPNIQDTEEGLQKVTRMVGCEDMRMISLNICGSPKLQDHEKALHGGD